MDLSVAVVGFICLLGAIYYRNKSEILLKENQSLLKNIDKIVAKKVEKIVSGK